ncbi:hypothetical protein, partial [Escherichia coli]
MGSCAAPSAKGDDKFITTDYLQQCPIVEYQSVRTKPEPEQVLAAEKLYAQLRSGKAARPKLAASFSV